VMTEKKTGITLGVSWQSKKQEAIEKQKAQKERMKIMPLLKKIISIFLILCMACSTPMCFPAAAQVASNYCDEAKITDIAQKIIAWAKISCGISASQSLLDDGLVNAAGTSGADWYAVGVERLGTEGEGGKFLAALNKGIFINIDNSTSPSFKATDIHRNILALLATGGDPSTIKSEDGSRTGNLLSDFVYNRGLTVSLGKQGVTGWIWGLVAVDSMQYNIPNGSYSSRDAMIVEILKQQRNSNGFSLAGEQSDPDITAMAVQALSPYYNSEKTYTYLRATDQASVTKTVRQVVDEALDRLSALQLNTGDYRSWGQRNAETGAQVALALCCLGIDPQKDTRFIKNGITLLDGILLYRMPDGGFAHILPADSSNSVTSEQILCAMAGILRQMKEMRKLYDFRPEQTATVKSAIAALSKDIASINGSTPKSQLQSMLAAYSGIVDTERMYVYNYLVLSTALKKAGATVSTGSSGSSSQTAPGRASSMQGASSDRVESSPDSAILEQSGNSSLESLNEDSSASETAFDSFAEQKGHSRQLTTVIAVMAILAILLVTGWLNIRQRRKKQQKMDFSPEKGQNENTDQDKDINKNENTDQD